MERCANCDREIGKLETPFLWLERVVCRHCHAVLSSPSLAPLEGPTRLNTDLPPRTHGDAGSSPLDELAVAVVSTSHVRSTAAVAPRVQPLARSQSYTSAAPPPALPHVAALQPPPAYLDQQPYPQQPPTHAQPYTQPVVQSVVHVHTTNVQTVITRQKAWSPGVAALLSFFFPGLGQMY